MRKIKWLAMTHGRRFTIGRGANRWPWTGIAAVVAGLVMVGAVTADTPNVLLLTVEGLRPDHLSCYGYARATSPILDRVAARGARFESVYAAAPWTIPSIISILTGLPPSAHGVDRRGARLPRSVDALPEILARHGYHAPGASYLLGYPEFERLGFEPPPSPDWNGRPLDAMTESLRAGAPEPFFVWLHYKWTHLPYDAPGDDLAAFRAEPLPDGEGIRAVRSQEMIPAGSVAFTEAEKRAVVDLYDAEVRRFDRDLGTLLAVLADRGVLARTIVAITADHGEELFDHGFVGHGSTSRRATLYGEVLRVPLVLAGPGIPKGRVVRGIVEQADLFPTLLEAVGIAPPVDRPCVSRLSAIGTGATIRHGVAHAETVAAGFQGGIEESRTRLRSITMGRWKGIVETSPHGESAALYDLRRDPGETTDLAPRRPDRVRSLKRALAAWIAGALDARLRFLAADGSADGAR
jgi:arylsulfatase A-like enzyme